MVDTTPNLAKTFASKFEALKSAKRAYFDAIKEFEDVHRVFFFHADTAHKDIPVFWEMKSPDVKSFKHYD